MPRAIVVRGLRSLAGVRLGIGILQGVALCLLYRAAETGAWPASNALIFAPLLLVVCFVPIIVVFGLANMRPRTLATWAITASVLIAALALHDASRAAEADNRFLWDFLGGEQVLRIWPSPTVVIFTLAGLAIAQTLVLAGDSDYAAIAAYTLYVDAAWKHAVEAAFAAAAVGLLWLLLWLGASLFNLIGVAVFAELIQERWFVLPTTAVTLACAVHFADANEHLVRRMRSRSMMLLSWLLPIMMVFAAGLAILLLTGLMPSLSARVAIGLPLIAAAGLLVLVNATYHDGLPEHAPPSVLRHAARIAALMLMPLVTIAGYGLSLRVAQYGWTTDRILVMACIVLAGYYALGYAVAAIWGGAWLRYIETCNIGTAFIAVAMLLALSTPIADPARLSVSNQLARLDSGVVPAEEFDFAYLRFYGARYGAAALERLKARQQGADALTIRRRAQEALVMTSPESAHVAPIASAASRAKIKVFAPGHALPASFLKQDWSKFKSWDLPRCFVDFSAECDAFLVDLSHDGRDEIVIDDHAQIIVMTADAEGTWSRVGHLVGPAQCKDIGEVLRAGKFEATAPRWSDLKVGKGRLVLANHFAAGDCP